jgi:hypothetical protein
MVPGALRRSEIAALDVEDLRFETDPALQDGPGRRPAPRSLFRSCLVEAMCAVRAVRAWIATASIAASPLFRSFSVNHELRDRRIGGRDVANLVQLLVRRSCLEGNFGGHSLRAGFVTAAAQAGVPLDNIMRTTRHASLPILMGYVRRATAFNDPALARSFREACGSSTGRRCCPPSPVNEASFVTSALYGLGRVLECASSKKQRSRLKTAQWSSRISPSRPLLRIGEATNPVSRREFLRGQTHDSGGLK